METQEGLKCLLESPDFLSASSNISRLIGKLKSAVQERKLYETHQILRTIYFRFINNQKKLTQLAHLLYHGSCYLLKHQEHVSGQDIATLYLEAASKQLIAHRESVPGSKANLLIPDLKYHTTSKTIDGEILDRVSGLAVNIPDTEVGQSKFIVEALKIFTPKVVNRELFHHVLARKFWQQKDYSNARYHYLHCADLENGEDIGKLLIEYQAQASNDSEVDLFIAQFIFQFLCLKRPIDSPGAQQNNNQRASTATTSNAHVGDSTCQRARSQIKAIALKIYKSYKSNHPKLAHLPLMPPTDKPLLNFSYFSIQMLDNDNDAAAFRMLCTIYKISTDRDPKYEGYLYRIGSIYFGLPEQHPKPSQGGGGILNNILMSLLEDDNPAPNYSEDGEEGVNHYDELD